MSLNLVVEESVDSFLSFIRDWYDMRQAHYNKYLFDIRSVELNNNNNNLHGKFSHRLVHSRELECETWSLTLKEERRLWVSENGVLRRIFGRKRDEVTGSGENYTMTILMICTLHPISFG